MKRDPLLDFSQSWLLEPLQEQEDERGAFQVKRMFGGLAVYYRGLMVLCLMEDPTQSHYKDKDYGYAIWNGLLLPTEREHHSSLKEDFPALVEHAVLSKWLYLPMAREGYDETAPKLIKRIARGDPRFGIEPGVKKKKRKTKTKASPSRPKARSKR